MIITCKCGQQLSVAEDHIGQVVECSACGESITVVAAPAPPPFAPPPPGPIAPRPMAPRKKGMPAIAIAAICLAVAFVMIMVLGIAAAIMLPAVARAREAARRASCANNLKHVGIVNVMVANDNRNMYFPMLDGAPGRFMFGPDEVYPEYLTDTSVLRCPSAPYSNVANNSIPDAIDDHSYIYLGYAVTNMEEAHAFADAYLERAQAGLPFDGDLTVAPGTGNNGGGLIYRLRENIERDVQLNLADIPVMMDWPINHIPVGSNVLFMDGHVEFIRLGTQFPVTEEFIGLIEKLERQGEQTMR